MDECSIPGCPFPIRNRARRLCNSHYQRWLSHGDPLGGGTPKGLPLKWLRRAVLLETDECIVWPFGTDDSGYGRLWWEGRLRRAHHVALILVGREAPVAPLMTRHLCGGGHLGCVNTRHLKNGTLAENMDDARRHGTLSMGEHRPTARLTDAAVREIRTSAVSNQRLADRFGVSESAVRMARNRQTWKHVA